MSDTAWPELPADEWHDTIETVHRWSQVVGKIRMVSSPWLNHSWSVTLYVTPTGLTTGNVPFGDEAFTLAFDFADPSLQLVTSTGVRDRIELADGLSVADFYGAVMLMMGNARFPVAIDTQPNEIADASPFPDDDTHRSFDVDQVRALHRALLSSQRVFERFRAGFRGKSSPVHFFWGSFDLAVTRFSGRLAPPHPGGLPNFPNDVAAEAYSHEVTSVGFWPGDRSNGPIYYAYAYPTPDGFAEAAVEPAGAGWFAGLGEFVCPYSTVVGASDPDAALTRFCESTHGAAADLAGWDRDHLECNDPHGPDWWARRPHSPTAVDTTERVKVRDDPDAHRYVITVDGAERGKAVYRRRGNGWLFVHTEIDPAFDGQGLGSTLVRSALDDVRRQGGSIVPLCPFVARWVDRHAEYQDLVDRDLLALLSRG